MRVFLSFPGAAGILRGDKTSPRWKPPKKVAVTRSPQLLFSRQVGGAGRRVPASCREQEPPGGGEHSQTGQP